VKVIGGRFAWLLGGHSSLCTDRRATSVCGTIDSQELRTSMLASKLATARIFRYTPTTSNSLTVSRCRLGIYRCHDLKQQGQRHLPHYLRQRTHGRRLTDGIDQMVLVFLLFCTHHFHSLILVIISMYLFGFGKLVERVIIPEQTSSAPRSRQGTTPDTIDREICHRKSETIAWNGRSPRPRLNSKEKPTNKVKKEQMQSMSYIYFPPSEWLSVG